MTGNSTSAPSILRALASITSPSGFPYASNGPLFRDGQFGRDSLETAEDLLELRPEIARAVILRLAELQGDRYDPRTGEEPGKIHHEYRALSMGRTPVAEESVAIFRSLAHEWHLAETDEELLALDELANYCTVDATPLYVRLVDRYCARFGPDILDQTYVPHRTAFEGTRGTIRGAVCAAIGWITHLLESSDLGLLEWDRQAPWAHRFQAWKDGATSYLHADGTLANFNGPMASIEVQGLTYDALQAALTLPLGDGAPGSHHIAALAARLQRQTLELFWMPDEQYFAMALDRDPHTGDVRPLRVVTSNPGALLDSSIFDSLAADERERYVRPVVTRVFSDELLTSVGIRCTCRSGKDLLAYPAYQSSYTVWHKETIDVAKGLRRQGFPHLADELERRLINVVNLAGPREFIYVLPDGRFGPIPGASGKQTVRIRSTNIPENEQAWTVAGTVAAKVRAGRRNPARLPPPGELERALLDHAGVTTLFRTVAEVLQTRQAAPVFIVETARGVEAEVSYVHNHLADVAPQISQPLR